MATIDNFTVYSPEPNKLGGLAEGSFGVVNPTDALGNRRGTSGACRLKGARFADIPTPVLFKAYAGANGVSVPVEKVEFDIRDNQNQLVAHVVMNNCTMTSWGLTAPEAPPVAAGAQNAGNGALALMHPDLEHFELISTDVEYKAGVDVKRYQR